LQDESQETIRTLRHF